MGQTRRRLLAKGGQRADELLSADESLELEKILAVVSDRLADIPNEHFLSGIQEAMRELVEFLGYDRCTFAEFVAGDYLNVLCSSATSSYEPLPQGRFKFQFPWFLAQLRAGKIVIMGNLPHDLPPEAIEEKRHCLSAGLRSHLSIPVKVGGRITSVLSFASVSCTRQWSHQTVARLKMLSEVLGCVLALARAEEEAKELRQRFWHTDRVERVSALAAAIAHDLNQPLTAILSNAQAGLRYLARLEGSHRAIKEVLESVVREDKRAAQTIRSMRSLFRKDEPKRQTFDLVSAIENVHQLLSGELASLSVKLEIVCAERCRVTANRVQIEQLCLNLIQNAATATRCRPPALHPIGNLSEFARSH